MPLEASPDCETDVDDKISLENVLEIAPDAPLTAIAGVAIAEEVRSFDVALDTDPGLLTGAETDDAGLPFAA